MTRIIAIASNKGGVGKTTTVMNLGESLARLGQRVLLVDLDPQNGLMLGMGLEELSKEAGFFSLLETGGDVDSLRVEMETDGLDVLLSGAIGPDGEFDRLLGLLSEQPGRIAAVLRGVATGYDFVLLDCAAGLGPATTAALVAATEVLIPLQCQPLALRTLGSFLHSVLSVRTRLNPGLALAGLLITMYDARLEAQERVAEQVWTSFPGTSVFEVVIPRHDSLVHEFGGGGPVSASLVKSVGAQAYMQLARELLSRPSRASQAAVTAA